MPNAGGALLDGGFQRDGYYANQAVIHRTNCRSLRHLCSYQGPNAPRRRLRLTDASIQRFHNLLCLIRLQRLARGRPIISRKPASHIVANLILAEPKAPRRHRVAAGAQLEDTTLHHLGSKTELSQVASAPPSLSYFSWLRSLPTSFWHILVDSSRHCGHRRSECICQAGPVHTSNVPMLPQLRMCRIWKLL